MMPDEPKTAGFLNIVPSADELQVAAIAVVDHLIAGLDGTIASLDGYELVLDLQFGGIPLRGRITLLEIKKALHP